MAPSARGTGATVSKGVADHAGRSRRLASSVQHLPLRAVACDWPARLACFAAPCMSRIPRGSKGEYHDYRRHHSGFDHYRCHLSHAPAQCRRLRLGGRRPLASAQAACIGSASALVAPMLDSICDGRNPFGFLFATMARGSRAISRGSVAGASFGSGRFPVQ